MDSMIIIYLNHCLKLVLLFRILGLNQISIDGGASIPGILKISTFESNCGKES